MAVLPLFNSDTATMQSELRLSGLKTGSDGERIFLRGMTAARIGLYMRLGTSVVSEMLAQSDTDNPTSLIQLRRKACSLAEVEWTRLEVLQTMPVIVADASGDAQQLFNDEGVWRGIDPDELEALLARIRDGLEELLELILAEDELGEDSSIRVYDGSRGTDNDEVKYPAGTLWAGIGKFTGNYGSNFIYGSSVVPVRFQLPE